VKAAEQIKKDGPRHRVVREVATREKERYCESLIVSEGDDNENKS
jgi:hypothetical protein